jgi:hypothetical protein
LFALDWNAAAPPFTELEGELWSTREQLQEHDATVHASDDLFDHAKFLLSSWCVPVTSEDCL